LFLASFTAFDIFCLAVISVSQPPAAKSVALQALFRAVVRSRALHLFLVSGAVSQRTLTK